MSKMVTKELKAQNNSESKKEVDQEKNRMCVMPIMKKDMLNPSNSSANALASSATSIVHRLGI